MISEQTWAALRAPKPTGSGAAGAREPGRGSTRDVVSRLTGLAPVSDEDGTVLPASTIATALCDCEITRLVLDAQGVPLDEGRARRLFTAHQRKAVVARDGGGCALPGCAIPARYTQLHHITWWSRAGRSDLDQAIQLCDRHHHDIHDHDVRIQRNRDGSYAFWYPDGRPMCGSPPPDTWGAAEPYSPATARDERPAEREAKARPALGMRGESPDARVTGPRPPGGAWREKDHRPSPHHRDPLSDPDAAR